MDALTAQKKLTRLFNTESFDIGRCAHLCIDVQDRYCLGSKVHANIAERIAWHIAPVFERLAIPSCYIWYENENNSAGKAPDFYEVNPLPHNKIIRKTTVSAFKSSDIDIDAILKADNIQHIFVTGFYFGACVWGTIRDARKAGYDVSLITNGTDFDKYAPVRQEMEDAQINFTETADLFPLLAKIRPPSPSQSNRHI